MFHSSAGDDAVDLAAVAGLVLDEWQEHVLRGSLGERRDGKWSAFEVGLVVPRQNGKNATLEARELAGLFLFGEELIIHSAHQFKTAQEAFLKILNRIKATPDLLAQVQGFRGDPDEQMSGIKTAHGAEGITLKNGNRLRFAARSGGSGRGFTGDLVIFDEAYALSNAEIAAMLPTMAAKSIDGNPQLWYTSSAGMPNSEVLASIRERGMSGDAGRLAYFEWSAEDDADHADPDVWARANPGFGIRISEEFIANELASPMGSGDAEEFKRERLGIWAKLGGESAMPAWGSVLDVSSVPGDIVAFALDVPPSRDSAAVSVAGFRPDGRKHVELVEQNVGTSWVAEFLRVRKERWGPVAVVAVAGSAAASLEPELRRVGVRLHLLSMKQYAEACGLLMDDVRDGNVRHIGQDGLDAAVDGARPKSYGESLFYWSRKSNDANISPLVSVTLANAGLQSKGLLKSAGVSRGKVLVM